jgi:hypothetical protein
MVKSDVFEKDKLSELPKDVKVIDTTWAMKKKSNGTLLEESMFVALSKSRDSITMHRVSVCQSQME